MSESRIHDLGSLKTPGVGEKCEIRISQQRYKNGRQETIVKDGLEPDLFNEDNSYALIANKIFTEKNSLEKTEVQINSPHILKAFRQIIGPYPTVPSDFEEPFELESPFRILFHYWDDIVEYRKQTKDDTARMHLTLLLDFMKAEFGANKVRCDSMIKKNQITFSQLWTLYRPGDLQYTSSDGHPWLLTVSKTAYEENTKKGKWFEVHCTYTDYDGINVGLANRVFNIYQKKNFAAENPAVITDLQVFPRKFLRGKDDLESELLKRGKRFLQLQGVLVKKYEGLALYLKDPPRDFYDPDMADWPGVWLPYTEAARIIIDRKTFQEENHLEQVSISPHLGDDDDDDDDEKSKTIQCPPFAYGFSLARKEWCRFYIDQIQEVEWNKNLFSSLVIGDSQKLLLRALVTSHTFVEKARDQPQQKGRGLVMLLHGTPGSGKTLTAESAAEMTGKALLSTTMGELNKENIPWYFERRLKAMLEYATIWKAIVVLDEADVFLEARQDTPNDGGERNALVAVFLQNLEYFSGIVFLTSNRVNVFDLAMKSRIHLAIEYSPPALKMRRLIWEQCLKATPSSEISIELLIKEEVNGREIANTVNTAKTLARFEEKPLQMRHLETVLQVRRDFDASIAAKRKAVEAAESRQGSLMLNRKNSILVSREEPSQWLP